MAIQTTAYEEIFLKYPRETYNLDTAAIVISLEEGINIGTEKSRWNSWNIFSFIRLYTKWDIQVPSGHKGLSF